MAKQNKQSKLTSEMEGNSTNTLLDDDGDSTTTTTATKVLKDGLDGSEDGTPNVHGVDTEDEGAEPAMYVTKKDGRLELLDKNKVSYCPQSCPTRTS